MHWHSNSIVPFSPTIGISLQPFITSRQRSCIEPRISSYFAYYSTVVRFYVDIIIISEIRIAIEDNNNRCFVHYQYDDDGAMSTNISMWCDEKA